MKGAKGWSSSVQRAGGVSVGHEQRSAVQDASRASHGPRRQTSLCEEGRIPSVHMRSQGGVDRSER